MFECIGCSAVLGVDPCICFVGEDWGNAAEAAAARFARPISDAEPIIGLSALVAALRR